MIKIAALSDTHGQHDSIRVPDADILIHAGDFSLNGGKHEVLDFLSWFAGIDIPHKIFVAGNHDSWVETNQDAFEQLSAEAGLHYLQDNGVEIEGLKFWGSPITPRFMDWSFMRESGEEIRQTWAAMPDDTDVLITHGPPHGVMDQLMLPQFNHARVGCRELLERIQTVSPQVHVFGHIHEGFGHERHGGCDFYNVSSVDEFYQLKNQPSVFNFLPER